MRHTADGAPVAFYHPAFQSTCMFLGEFLCIIPYLMQRWRTWSEKQRQVDQTPFESYYESAEPLLHGAQVTPAPHMATPQRASSGPPLYGEDGNNDDMCDSVFLLALPTLCDAASTTLMNIGLYYTSASTFQMLRGLVVLFAGPRTVHPRSVQLSHFLWHWRQCACPHWRQCL